MPARMTVCLLAKTLIPEDTPKGVFWYLKNENMVLSGTSRLEGANFDIYLVNAIL
ncbi:hypothetical protein SCFA_1870007 [anaerobic digester metagenome]|uniref:Uncharacterized protein n=1 Tax=anaerobic digester metagenome TaxID=1263854 RepID=A0A485LX99_9ZZZZ